VLRGLGVGALKGFDITALEKTPPDAGKYISEPEDVIDFLNDAFESGHAPRIAKVLRSPAPNNPLSYI
jgi:DNA-binding phage protein